MRLPAQLAPGSHVLHVSRTLGERLSLFEQILVDAADVGRLVVAVVHPKTREIFEATARLVGVRPRQMHVTTAAEILSESEGVANLAKLLVDALEALENAGRVRRREEPRMATVLFCDLDDVFARCASADEMLRVVRDLKARHATERGCVVEAVSVDLLPRSLPPEFLDLHTDWVFSAATVAGSDAGASLDAAAQRVSLRTPELRASFLALARSDPHGALHLVPRPFSDYRRGFLVVDRELVVRYCSPRAAALLARGADEITERPLGTVIDGVDLVTLRHECARDPGADQSPFVVSWRLAPGRYEPREVTVDPISSDHSPVGHLISLGPVESVRGPRAVYRQLTKERGAEALVTPEEAEPVEEALGEALQGTQITKREHQVLLHILAGRSNREIARHFDIAEVTVKKHLTSVYRKLRITNRAELIRSFTMPNGTGSAPGSSE